MKNCAAAIFLVITILGAAADGRPFSFRAGIGYDFISQEYFLDSLIRIGEDSLEADLTLKTNYLDDIKGFIGFTFNPLEDRRLEVRTVYEQTRELVRLRGYTDSRLKLGRHRLSINSEFDWRGRYQDEIEAGDEYLYGLARSRLDLNISQKLTNWWLFRGSFVNFDSTLGFTYDHYRLEGNGGLSRIFSDFSIANGYLFLSTRQVPDSSELNYLSFGADGSLLAFYNDGTLDVNARFERKNYNSPDDEDDYTRLEIFGVNEFRISERYWTRQELESEYAHFSDSDLVNSTFLLTEVSLQAGLKYDFWQIWAGPQLEFLTAEGNDFGVGEDYLQLALEVDLSVLRAGSLFASFESITGYRNLRFNDDLQTDFLYQRASLIGDASVIGYLRFNILFSAEWEWHDIESRDNRLYLLSTTLAYSF